MKMVRIARLIVLLAALGTVSAVPAASQKGFEEATSADGLEKIKVRNIDLVYVRPGATLAEYTKVMIEPVRVAFRKDFDPQRSGSRTRLTTDELEKIRTDVGKIVQEQFVKELAKGTYVTAAAAGPDVLQIRLEIEDLYVNAPDTMEPGRSRTYTTSAGEMTLVMELVDSETGATLARVYDRHDARGVGTLTWANSVTNRAEAERAAATWARILRERLDAARGIGKK